MFEVMYVYFILDPVQKISLGVSDIEKSVGTCTIVCVCEFTSLLLCLMLLCCIVMEFELVINRYQGGEL